MSWRHQWRRALKEKQWADVEYLMTHSINGKINIGMRGHWALVVAIKDHQNELFEKLLMHSPNFDSNRIFQMAVLHDNCYCFQKVVNKVNITQRDHWAVKVALSRNCIAIIKFLTSVYNSNNCQFIGDYVFNRHYGQKFSVEMEKVLFPTMYRFAKKELETLDPYSWLLKYSNYEHTDDSYLYNAMLSLRRQAANMTSSTLKRQRVRNCLGKYDCRIVGRENLFILGFVTSKYLNQSGFGVWGFTKKTKKEVLRYQSFFFKDSVFSLCDGLAALQLPMLLIEEIFYFACQPLSNCYNCYFLNLLVQKNLCKK